MILNLGLLKIGKEEGMGMKKRKKNLEVLIIVLLLGLSTLAACGNSANNTTQPETSKTNDNSSDEVITLTFPCIWVGADSKAEVFGNMVRGFNEEYAGKYEVIIEEQTDYDAYEDKIRTLVSTGAAPDIFTMGTYADLELFSKSGKLMDLTEFLESEGMAGRFVEGVVDNAKIEGVNYAFPYENAVISIMFNERLLDEAGVEAIPQTYEELWEACEALQAINIIPTTQMTNDNAWTSMLWYSYALAACGGPDVYENGLDDPAFVEAAEILKKMFDYTSSDAIGADATVVNGHFFNERAAIYTNGSWILGRIQTEGVEGLYDNLALSAGLSVNGENGGAYVNAVQAYIAAGVQEDPAKEEAVKAFFKYITEADKIVELSNSSGALFAIDIDASSITDPLLSEIAQQSSDAPFMIGHFQASVSTAVVNEFSAALESLVLGDVTAEGFVEQLKAADE